MAPMPFAEYRERLEELDAASLCDAAAATGVPIGVVDPAIHRVSRGGRMIGVARPVVCDLDFLEVWRALADAQAGEALLIAAASDRAVVGELFAAEAERRGLTGIVVDGYCRDTARLSETRLPIYARGTTPRAGTTDVARGAVATVPVGGVVVAAGDLIFGDGDGVVVVPAARVTDLVPAAEEVQRREAAILATVGRGGSIFDHTNLDDHYRRRAAGQPSQLQVRSSPAGSPESG